MFFNNRKKFELLNCKKTNIKILFLLPFLGKNRQNSRISTHDSLKTCQCNVEFDDFYSQNSIDFHSCRTLHFQRDSCKISSGLVKLTNVSNKTYMFCESSKMKSFDADIYSCSKLSFEIVYILLKQPAEILIPPVALKGLISNCIYSHRA